MQHIFISHAGRDSLVATRLHDDLRNCGHDVRIDLKELTLGDDTIDFMNDAIANAHTVIILYSQHTPNAKWQRLEINAAVWNQTAQSGGKVIVLKVDDTNLPPLLGPRMYGSLVDDQYHSTLKKLCTEITSQPTDTSLVCEALHEGSSNPFWRVRAEYFEEMPALLAKAFSPPDAAKARVLEEMKPCFLEGSRGTGKTMLLLSLRGRIYSSRPDASKSLASLFGFYFRLTKGAFCNAGVRALDEGRESAIPETTLDQLTDTYAQELYLGLTESMISELSFCVRAKHLSLEADTELKLVRAITAAFHGPGKDSSSTLAELLAHCAELHRQLSDFVRRKFIYQEPCSIPFTCFDLDVFKRVIALVKSHVPLLSQSQFTILLDEYENLSAYQKLVANSLIKLGPPHLSVKVARKVGTEETSKTTVAQELQETHDYNRIPLIYSVEDDADFRRYLELLENMVKRLLETQGLATPTLTTLLPHFSDEEVSASALRPSLLALLKLSNDEYEGLSQEQQAKKATYYREAAVYRHLYGTSGRRTRKRFAGRNDLAFISSGVIRYFQEILGMAYHLQATSGKASVESIDPQFQSDAVHTVSGHNLATLSRNVELYGEALKYFLLDVGDCLRQKLLRHTSEPEAARIAIKDPHLLRESQYVELSAFLNLGVKEGVFQTMNGRPGIRPKHVEDPQPVEFTITRIFAPALQISPRLRWTSPATCSELAGLLDATKRRASKAKLIKRWAGSGENATAPSATLFSEDDHEADA